MNKSIIIGAVCLVVGVVGTAAYCNAQNKSYESDTQNTHGSMNNSMDSMMLGLQGKTGDEFDKAFITEMIAHHQGAVKMAEAALVNAKHQEIKDLASAIISAQNKEIKDMTTWQEQWYNIK